MWNRNDHAHSYFISIGEKKHSKRFYEWEFMSDTVFKGFSSVDTVFSFQKAVMLLNMTTFPS